MTAASARRETARPPLVEALLRPDSYGPAVERVRLVETHISWVFLTGQYAYKVKKPVKLPFLDFGTLEQRRRYCREELRLNRRLAPELYLDVVPIGGTPAAPRIGKTPALEYAVKMREFPAEARLDRRIAADDVDAQPVRAFAARLARFHADLPPLAPVGAAAEPVAEARANFTELESRLAGRDLATLERLRDWSDRRADDLAPVFAARVQRGAYRECHGDLHLENLLLAGGEIVAFDALEFDPKLREIDVASEAAFVTMDLLAHGRADLASVFLTAYLETAGDYGSLAVLPFYLVYRALVRAKVSAIKAAQASAEHGRDELGPYLKTAAELAAPRRPLLLITHGLSGSGKTHVTTELVARLPALRVRSDLERKRLHGLRATARSGSAVGGGLYTPAANRATYAVLGTIADTALRAGFDMIVDATFLRRAERAHFRQIAAANAARFAILDCRAAERELRARIAARAAGGGDASEATTAVLDGQLAEREPFDASERHEAVRVATDRSIRYGSLLAELGRR